MTGSSLAPIVIAIVVSAALAVWLAMVYYAASHPQWKHAGGRHVTVAQPDARPAVAASAASGPESASRPEVPRAA